MSEYLAVVILVPMMLGIFGYVFVKLTSWMETRAANQRLDYRLQEAKVFLNQINFCHLEALRMNQALVYAAIFKIKSEFTTINATGRTWQDVRDTFKQKISKCHGPGIYEVILDGPGHRGELWVLQISDSDAFRGGWIAPKLKVIEIYPVKPMGRVDEDHILFDRESLAEGHQVQFFQNPRVDCLSNKPKSSIDTNMIGSGGALCRGFSKKITGISLVPDSDVPDEFIEKLRNNGKLVLRLGGNYLFKEWPLRTILANKKTSNNEPVFKFQSHSLVEIVENENFSFELTMGGTFTPIIEIPRDLPRFMLLLFGPLCRGIA